MLGRATVDAYCLAIEVQFTGVAGRTRDVEILLGAAGILVPGETYRQIARVVRRGFLLRVDQKAKAREVFRGGKTLLRERQLQRLKPFVTKAFDLRPLRSEVVGLALLLSPLVQVMHLFCGRGEGQSRIGDIVKNHRQNQSQQHHDQRQHTV